MNKHLHIWAGRFAYLAGVVQCYRGVELVSSGDSLLFSTLDIDIKVPNLFPQSCRDVAVGLR